LRGKRIRYTGNSRYKHTVGTRGDMLIVYILISRENYALQHMCGDHEGMYILNYMLISGMLITRVICSTPGRV